MLTRDIFGKFLIDSRRGILGWMIGVAAVTALYSSFWPSMRETGDAMAAFVEQMPQLAESMGWSDLTSAEGYLGSTVFGLLTPILITIAAIAFGTRAIAGEEEEGALELVLSHPVGRYRVLLQRFAALVVFVALLGLTIWVVLLALSPALDLDIAAGRLAAAALGTALIGLCYGTLALAVGAVTGRRVYAIGGAAVLAVVGYLGNTFALQQDELEWMRFLSPFYYALDPEPLRNGIDPAFTAVLVGIPLVLAGLGLARFARRDVLV
ncbi:ABC transporter permease subunit [Streptomonospora litoralis]|uniref:ABC-2 family transporter protein n=1 Tax=Streptomonospora litoralis TaxID=2498135 RepID=A0A4P6Q8U4_9ACTN|nr:ABC transporter permease subunit [Streptomonospora litoralis]QBI55679.1 ABC-2 family transporter protein [Streptomonospora litoralis]